MKDEGVGVRRVLHWTLVCEPSERCCGGRPALNHKGWAVGAV
jgi:hypothetical protein